MKQSTLETLIRKQDWVYENAGTCWRDGLILGNGNIGVLGYAPYGLEWVFNKPDVFDGRIARGRLLPHKTVMERFHREHLKNLMFLAKEEAPPPGTPVPLSLSAGILHLQFGDDASWNHARPHKVRQRLCLWEGELYYDLDLYLSHPRMRCFVPRGWNLFCSRLEHVGAMLWGHNLELARPFEEDLKTPVWKTGRGLVLFRQEMPHGRDYYAMAVLAVPTRGPDQHDLYQKLVHPRYRIKESSVAEGIHKTYHGVIPQKGNADIFVSIYSTRECADPEAAVLKEVHRAVRTGFEAIEREHHRWWRSFWQRGWADFGTHQRIQKYWTFSLYETAALLGRAPVPGLHGNWYGPTRSSSNMGTGYCHDQNVEIPVMPVFACNRSDLADAFVDTYLNMLPVLKRNTKRLFGRRGACVPLNVNQMGEELHHTGPYRYSLCGGAYNGIILVWAWRYTRDQTLLRTKWYPLLREYVRFYVDGMTKGDDGRYHLDWEVPPELFTLSRDCTATLGLLKPCLETCVEASRLLKRDARERVVWQDILDRYPEIPKRAQGDWWAGADLPHDHYTQAAYLLYPFFPGEMAVDENGEMAAKRTLDRLKEHDIEVGYADKEGYWHFKRSWAWFFPTVAQLRLGRKKAAWKALHECLRLYAKPNGLLTHNATPLIDPRIAEHNVRLIPRSRLRHADGICSPLTEFQALETGPSSNPSVHRWMTPASEGSGAFLMVATETLLQSHGGLIRLFPGVPDDFTGEFHHLLAQGAFEISACMKTGRVTWVRVKSLVGGTARLLIPWQRGVHLPQGSCIEKKRDGRRVLCLTLNARQVWEGSSAPAS